MDISEPPNEPPKPKRQKTASERLQEEMQRQLAPFRQLSEMQDLIGRYSPDVQLKEILKQYEDSRNLQSIRNQYALPAHVQELLDGTSAAIRAQRLWEQSLPRSLFGLADEASRKALFSSPVADILKAYERYLKPASEHREWLEKIQQQALGGVSAQIFAQRLAHANPALAALADARKSLESLWGTFHGIDVGKFVLGEDEEHEAEDAARTISAAASSEQTLQAAVDQIVEAIQKQQKPSVRFLLLMFFLTIMDWVGGGVVGSLIDQHMPQNAAQSRQEATKSVKEVARSVVGSAEFLSDYRFVSAKVLIVRQNPKARSPEIGRIGFGKAVKLLKKDKDFALVVWADRESGAQIQGWVFARYLGKFD